MGSFGVDVSEVFNPGIFTNAAPRYGLNPGHAFDMTLPNPHGEPWNFDREDHQKWCEQIVSDEKPALLVGSPMCKGFSSLMNLNVRQLPREKVVAIIEQCMKHLRFVFRLYEIQRKGGRWFLHEHPWGAWSWHVDFVQDMAAKEMFFW